MRLSKFEDAALRFILESEAPSLMDHLDHILVSSRENTGVGMYVNFTYEAAPATRFEVSKATLGASVFAEVNVPGREVGFLLYIDDGLISMLEVFSHGAEDFPSHIEKCEFGHLE